MKTIERARALAATLGLLCAANAAYRAHTTQNFIATATPIQALITRIDPDAAVSVKLPSGKPALFTATNATDLSPGKTIPLLIHTDTNGAIDLRSPKPHDLWSPTWTWIEAAVAAFLAAIYGRQLITDPLSVIGFKSATIARARDRGPNPDGP